MRLSKEREDIWSKVKSAREEYACLKQQHLMELEEQARRMTMAEVVSPHIVGINPGCIHMYTVGSPVECQIRIRMYILTYVITTHTLHT